MSVVSLGVDIWTSYLNEQRKLFLSSSVSLEQPSSIGTQQFLESNPTVEGLDLFFFSFLFC
jgi:hypothetical protein